MNVYEAIRSKHSVRQFSETGLYPEGTASVLNAGRLAGSSKNSQPWHFLCAAGAPAPGRAQ